MLLGVCLTLAGALHAMPVFVAVEQFTLAWTHSIEKVRWEEDYGVVASADGQRAELHALKARVRGSAAGMEPPEDAQLRNGWFEYTPTLQSPSELRLMRSDFTADYDWCVNGQCQPMSNLIASDAGVTRLKPCFDAQGSHRLSPTNPAADQSPPPAKYPSVK